MSVLKSGTNRTLWHQGRWSTFGVCTLAFYWLLEHRQNPKKEWRHSIFPPSAHLKQLPHRICNSFHKRNQSQAGSHEHSKVLLRYCQWLQEVTSIQKIEKGQKDPWTSITRETFTQFSGWGAHKLCARDAQGHVPSLTLEHIKGD